MLWALLFAVCFEGLVARSDWYWSEPERSQSGAFHAVESRVMARRPSPSVIVLGSSRIRDAVVPSTLERELGLDIGRVANAALTAGSAIDARELLRRNAAWFAGARIAIVGVEDWYFLPGAVRERDRRFANLGELKAAWGDRGGPFRAHREYALKAPLAIRRLGSVLREGPRAFRDMPLDEEGRLLWRRRDAESGPTTIDAESQIEQYYSGTGGAVWRTDALRDVVAEARELGLRVVLTQVPLREEYVDAVEVLHPASWAEYQARVRSLSAELSVPLFEVARGSELGVRGTQFLDYGHLTRSGGEAFTRALAEWLRAERVTEGL